MLNASYPQNVTVVASASVSASFSVVIATPGVPAEYTYQWYRNGSAVSGQTNATYTMTGLTSAATYNVYCKVTNKAGSVNSRVATLTVQSYLPSYTYTGSHQLIDDGNFNWQIKFLTSGTLKFTSLGSASSINTFLVGGGGGGSTSGSFWGCGGGGGGYTTTASLVPSINTQYPIVVGAGGAGGANGGNTTAFGYSASGGKTGNGSAGGAGGSGGGGGAGNDDYHSTGSGGAGGSDGGNGGNGADTGYGGAGGAGQNSTTREFGESGNTLYAGGGGGNGKASNGDGGAGGGGTGGTSNGTTNTGGGGGGPSKSGGSGIVIIRNAR